MRTHCVLQEGWGTPLNAACTSNGYRAAEALLASGNDFSDDENSLLICSHFNYPLCVEICMKYGMKVSENETYALKISEHLLDG